MHFTMHTHTHTHTCECACAHTRVGGCLCVGVGLPVFVWTTDNVQSVKVNECTPLTNIQEMHMHQPCCHVDA